MTLRKMSHIRQVSEGILADSYRGRNCCEMTAAHVWLFVWKQSRQGDKLNRFIFYKYVRHLVGPDMKQMQPAFYVIFIAKMQK